MRQSHKKGTQVECKLLRWLIKLPGSLQVSRGAIAQLGERIVRNDEVVGSIPTSSTMFSSTYRPCLGQCCSIVFQKIQPAREFASQIFRGEAGVGSSVS